MVPSHLAGTPQGTGSGSFHQQKGQGQHSQGATWHLLFRGTWRPWGLGVSPGPALKVRLFST